MLRILKNFLDILHFEQSQREIPQKWSYLGQMAKGKVNLSKTNRFFNVDNILECQSNRQVGLVSNVYFKLPKNENVVLFVHFLSECC